MASPGQFHFDLTEYESAEAGNALNIIDIVIISSKGIEVSFELEITVARMLYRALGSAINRADDELEKDKQ